MIDDWLVFDIGWTVLAIMVKRWAKGMGLRGTLQLMQDKDDILFRVGRPTIKNNEQLVNMTLCTQSHPADISLDCSPTTIERHVGETRGWYQRILSNKFISLNIKRIYIPCISMNNFTKSKSFFLHWDRPTAGNLYCNRIPRNYWIGSNRIIKKEK